MATMQIHFLSKALNRYVSFNAIVPIDRFGQMEIEHNDTKEFKTLYLLNGFFGNHMDWMISTKIEAYANTYNVAVIMPAGDNSFYIDDVDKREFYSEFIGEELPEYTRKLLPLSKNREDTWIGGLSMGGYGALMNGLKYHHTFGKIIALSSALIIREIIEKGKVENGITDERFIRRVIGTQAELVSSDKNPEYQARQMKEKGIVFPEIYMACGSEDFLIDKNREFVDFLKEEEIAHTYAEGPGVHDWAF
ncbi:MAG: acetylesterase, partial [Vallitaleaceae bacterium]|nr:acetylesterase [Vallitaleaceae bacterium]